jgi:hypothetical protein
MAVVVAISIVVVADKLSLLFTAFFFNIAILIMLAPLIQIDIRLKIVIIFSLKPYVPRH